MHHSPFPPATQIFCLETPEACPLCCCYNYNISVMCVRGNRHTFRTTQPVLNCDMDHILRVLRAFARSCLVWWCVCELLDCVMVNVGGPPCRRNPAPRWWGQVWRFWAVSFAFPSAMLHSQVVCQQEELARRPGCWHLEGAPVAPMIVEPSSSVWSWNPSMAAALLLIAAGVTGTGMPVFSSNCAAFVGTPWTVDSVRLLDSRRLSAAVRVGRTTCLCIDMLLISNISSNRHIYIYIYIYIYTYFYICFHLCTYKHTYKNVCTYKYVHTHMYSIHMREASIS